MSSGRSTAMALKLVRVAGGLLIFAGSWQLTSNFETAAAIIAMGIATGATIGGAYALSLWLEPSERDTAQTSFPVPAAEPGPSKTTQDEALADFLGLIASGAVIPSQDWLTERWGLGSKGTTSKWLSKWERAGYGNLRARIG